VNSKGERRFGKKSEEDDEYWPVYLGEFSLTRRGREKYSITGSTGDQIDSKGEGLEK
jgi:hypothetical protein